MNTQLIHLTNKSLQPLVFILLFFFVSCSKDPVSNVDCSGVTPTYSTGIKSILDASCAKSGCHDAYTHEQGLDFSSYGNASDASHNNSFLGSIQHKNGYNPMPQNSAKLSADKIQLLTCWVENGSPE